MTRICPSCHKALEREAKYCSVRCARAMRRQRRRIFFAAALGALILALAIHSAPVSEFRAEPRLPLSAVEIQRLAVDDLCPICAGKGKVDCKVCIAGKIFYMGTSADCSRCEGKGWIICPACAGAGDLNEALRLARLGSRNAK